MTELEAIEDELASRPLALDPVERRRLAKRMAADARKLRAFRVDSPQ